MSNNIAQIILDGNLTSDPELKTTTTGKSVTTFTLANNFGFSDNSETNDVSFIDIEVWDKNAENCAEYLKKGRKVTVIGTLRQDRWKSPDGSNRQKMKVVANVVRFDYYANNNKEKKLAA